MSDIVERLLARKEPTIEVDMHYPQIVDSDTPDAECLEAAAEIKQNRIDLEEYRLDVERLRASLEWAAVQFANHNLPAFSHQCRVYAEGE